MPYFRQLVCACVCLSTFLPFFYFSSFCDFSNQHLDFEFFFFVCHRLSLYDDCTLSLSLSPHSPTTLEAILSVQPTIFSHSPSPSLSPSPTPHTTTLPSTSHGVRRQQHHKRHMSGFLLSKVPAYADTTDTTNPSSFFPSLFLLRFPLLPRVSTKSGEVSCKAKERTRYWCRVSLCPFFFFFFCEVLLRVRHRGVGLGKMWACRVRVEQRMRLITLLREEGG